jgi:hypothetical protein
MKRIYLNGFILLIANITAFGQITAVQLKTVEKLVLSGAVQLEVQISDEYSLEIPSADQGMNCFFQEVADGMLTLKLTTATGCPEKVKAVLRIPAIPELELSGKAEITSHNLWKCDSLLLSLKNGSQAYLDLDVKYLEARLSEGSLLISSGYAVRQKIDINTKATFSAFELESEKSDITAGTMAVVKVCVSDELKAICNSNAYIGYKCGPEHTDLRQSLGGKIEEYTE